RKQEEKLEEIIQLRQDGIAVILSAIKLKMKELLRTKFKYKYLNALETFEASNNNFYNFIKKSQHINNYELSSIANMDKMPIYFDIVNTLTVDHPSAKTIVEAWNDIPVDMVINLFKKYGIPNSIEELKEQVIVLAEDIENFLIPIVYVENLENLLKH
ncbi:28366_t:CDS:2, partial [Racocetra persica]